MPGENDDELIIEVDHHNSDHSADLLDEDAAKAHNHDHNEHCKMKGNKDLENKNKKSHQSSFFDNIDFLDLIILDHDCQLVQIWYFLFLVSCLTSGYFYGWIALFGIEEDDRHFKTAIYVYESIFSIWIVINFLTEYIPEGEVIPVRNLTAIS